MSDNNRWNKAQDYEKSWWEKRHKVIDLSYLKKFAEELTNQISPYYNFDSTNEILEIGSGPAGILTHLEGTRLCAVDPLENFYSSVKEYAQYRNPKVEYFAAMGESLPFDDNSFNLIIIDNVLDHCQNPAKVIEEASRVLKSGGLIYFKQNVYHIFGKFIRNTLEKFEFDKGHPHNFTKHDITDLFKKYNYHKLHLSSRGHIKQLLVEIKMKNLKAILRILTLMTRDKITLIIQKQGA